MRGEQLARLKALELQPGDELGQSAWGQAYEQWRQLPDSARIDLPSPHVFGRVLGLFRTGATLKTGKLLRLEISAQEMADLLGYSKSTIESALRWLGSGPIDNKGVRLAHGLGIIHRGRRTAIGFLDGVLRRIYRTSRLVLTLVGRMLLGLGERDEERRREQREAKWRVRQNVKAATPAAHVQRVPLQEHPQCHVDDGGGPGTDPAGDNYDVGRAWIRKIQSSL